MPKPEEHLSRDYSKLDALSTEALKELLYQDSLREEGSDPETILHIMEVVAEREAQDPARGYTPVEDAWKSFNENYFSEDCDGTSLFVDSEDGAVEDEKPNIRVVAQKPKNRRLRSFLRVAGIAAVLLVVLLAGSLTAYAMGFDVWGTMAQWTEDVFSLMVLKEEPIYAKDEDPRDVLKEYGITVDILPNWLPDGYQFENIEVSDTPSRKVFYILYSKNSNCEIWMTLVLLSEASARTYEKSGQDVTIYIKNDIKHYIMQNIYQTNIVWNVGNCECSIIGELSIEEAQTLINSIYED